jgi:predicted ArsR family transcriptional regulator
MVASAWMCDPNHTTNARVLYAILAAYTRGMDRQAIHCVPNRHRLAAMLGVDADAFTAALAELEAAGMVTATWRADRRGRVTTVYQLHDAALLFGAVTAAEGAADETAGSSL